MMQNLWKRHIAWRLRAHPPVGGISDMPITAEADGTPCTRCKTPVEDAAFKYCRACRAQANKNTKKRARKHKREGRCPKCGGPRGVETVVCSGCLAKGRATYRNRKG